MIIFSSSTIRRDAKLDAATRDNFDCSRVHSLSRSLYDREARKIFRLINRLSRFMHTTGFIHRRYNNTRVE